MPALKDTSGACQPSHTCKNVLLCLRMLRLLELLLLLGSLLPGICCLQLPQQLRTVCRGRLWLLLVLGMLIALHKQKQISQSGSTISNSQALLHVRLPAAHFCFPSYAACEHHALGLLSGASLAGILCPMIRPSFSAAQA